MRRLALLLTAIAALWGTASASAARWTGPCLPGGSGPTCHFWTAKVTRIADGDTIGVDLDGDHGHREYRIRFIDVQAMEQSVYSSKHPERRRGQCHALEATARMEQLVRRSHWRVRLGAQDPASHAGSRLRRSVAVKIAGRWKDIGLKLMQEGHTLWMADTVEDAWNQRYNRAEQEAARKGVGLWNPIHCGAGPSQDVPIRVWVSWDPLGKDVANINGEWIKVENASTTTPLPLAGWWVRDAMLRRFTFPPGTVLGPGETATVHAGHGTASGDTFYWGLDVAPFQNAGDSRHLGDGGYLFDPQGDLRASMVYPCVVACADPNQGAMTVTAQPRRPESVAFRNVSSHPVDLYGYEMETASGSSYDFEPGSVVEPGETLRLYVDGDQSDDSRLVKHWGVDRWIFPDGGGSVRLTTFTDITLACDAWGAGRCG